MPELDDFKRRFCFDQEKTLHVGVERECFITNGTGRPIPRAKDVLDAILLFNERLSNNSSYGYELSACQLEARTGPWSLDVLADQLAAMDHIAARALHSLGLDACHDEVAPEDMPLDVYPDPTGRYQEIKKSMPPEQLLAACRVIGTHVHIGMPDHDAALRVYNRVIGKTSELCALGDKSAGRRLDIYRTVAPACDPTPYVDWPDFYEQARTRRFANDPRKCWTLIRISIHGTIEFRMFGATRSTEEVVSWARTCHDLCREAME